MSNSTEVKEVDITWLNNFMQLWENEPKSAPRGRYWAKDDESDVFVAVDNSTGDAWTEEFNDPKECTAWLSNPQSEPNSEEIDLLSKEELIFSQAVNKIRLKR